MRSASSSPAYLVPYHAQLLWIALRLPHMNRNSFRHPSSRLLPLLALPALGRWGPAAVGVTGYHRLSSSACNALPALAGGINFIAHMTRLYLNVAYHQQYPLPLRTNILSTCLFRRASCRVSTFLYVNCTRFTALICLSPPLNASAWVEILLL